MGVEEEGALAGPRPSFLHSLYPTNSQRHLLGGDQKVLPSSSPQSLAHILEGEGQPTGCFLLIENFVILILQGSFHSLEPRKPFLSLKYFPWPQALRP